MSEETQNKKIVTGRALLLAYNSVLMLRTNQKIYYLMYEKIKSHVCHLEFLHKLIF